MSKALVDKKDCIGCNTCSSVCPVDAIELREEGHAFANDKCIACGACCVVCPTQCIKIVSLKEWYEEAKKVKSIAKSLNLDKD